MNRMLVVALIVFTSCRTQENNSGTRLIQIDPSSNEKNVAFSEMFNKSEFIQLETNESYLLGELQHAKISGDNLYVLSTGRTNGVYHFKKNGSFVRKFSSKGEGPSEYGYIQNFELSEKFIYLLDNEQRKILIYSKDGSYQKYVKLNFFALDFKVINEGYVFYCGNSSNGELAKKLIFTDTAGTILHSVQDVSLKQANYLNITPNKVFSSLSNSLSYSEPFSNTLYSISQFTLLPKYQIDFGKYNLPSHILNGNHANIIDFLGEARSENFAFLFANFLETNERLYFTHEYAGAGNRFMNIVFKKNFTHRTVQSFRVKVNAQEVNLNVANISLIGGDSSGKVLFAIYPYDLQEYLPASSQELDNSSLESNPILILASEN